MLRKKNKLNSQSSIFNKQSFTERVRAVVRDIPKGATMSYREVAMRAGSPNAARAVGNIMRNNYDKTIPCHRVIKSDGGLGGYNRGGVVQKAELLRKEARYAGKSR